MSKDVKSQIRLSTYLDFAFPRGVALLRQDVFPHTEWLSYVKTFFTFSTTIIKPYKTIKTLGCYWKVQRHRQKVVEARKDVLDVVQVSGVADAYVADEE